MTGPASRAQRPAPASTADYGSRAHVHHTDPERLTGLLGIDDVRLLGASRGGALTCAAVVEVFCST